MLEEDRGGRGALVGVAAKGRLQVACGEAQRQQGRQGCPPHRLQLRLQSRRQRWRAHSDVRAKRCAKGARWATSVTAAGTIPGTVVNARPAPSFASCRYRTEISQGKWLSALLSGVNDSRALQAALVGHLQDSSGAECRQVWILQVRATDSSPAPLVKQVRTAARSVRRTVAKKGRRAAGQAGQEQGAAAAEGLRAAAACAGCRSCRERPPGSTCPARPTGRPSPLEPPGTAPAANLTHHSHRRRLETVPGTCVRK